MQKLYSSVLETIGNTPVVRVKSIGENALAKLEFFNPCGSVKGRIALSMLKAAFDEGRINQNSTIIEPTSGNTGIGLAFCCAAMGLKFVAVMPENMTDERKKLIKAYGAELVLTPKEAGMQGSVDKADELAVELGEGAFIPMQFENPNNPLAHIKTANEILEQTGGNVDYVVAGVGTGGTITGIGKRFKELNHSAKMIAVQAAESPLLTGGAAGPHKIQGISANFIPKTLDLNFVSEIINIKGDDAILTARKTASKEGLLVGISSGAVLSAMEVILKRDGNGGKTVLGILADNGERYLSGELYE